MLEPGGVVGDRRFWLLDEHGALYNGKRNGSLQSIRPEWNEATRDYPDLSRTEPGSRAYSARGAGRMPYLYRLRRASHQVFGPWQEATPALRHPADAALGR